MICTWESTYRLYLSEEISYTDCPKITTSHLTSLKLWWAWKRCFVACESLPAIAKHCNTFLQSHDCVLGAWQPVHTFNCLPSTRQSCEYLTVYNLLCCHLPRGLPFVCLGWLKELYYAEILWQAPLLIHLPYDPGDQPGDLLTITTECWDCDCWAKLSPEFPWMSISLNYWDSTTNHDLLVMIITANLVRILFNFILHWTASSVSNSFQHQLLRLFIIQIKIETITLSTWNYISRS